MKKRWYDYLWILSLTYLILGSLIFCLRGLGFCAFLSPCLSPQ